MRRRGQPLRALLLAAALAAGLLAAGCAATDDGSARLTIDERRQLARHSALRQAPPPRSHTLQPAAEPMPLRRADAEPRIGWTLDGQSLSLDDYLRRQPVVALLVAQGDRILVERYAFGRGAGHHFLSNSMAKSVVGLGLGIARQEGRLRDFEQPLEQLVPALQGSAYGQTRLRDLMRMGSGVHFVETYEPGDDSSRYRQLMQRDGLVRAARAFDTRDVAPGTRFNYAGPDTALAGAALQAVAGESLAQYLQPRLWQAIGAEGPADWLTDPLGLELGHCCLYARPHDWLRLGIVLAHDGRRPDTGAQVFDPGFLLEATDAARLEPAFRPRRGQWGYSHFFWVMDGPARRFALLGVYGQAIFVDPARRLVMVHLAANATARASQTSMARERFALWQGLLRSVGP